MRLALSACPATGGARQDAPPASWPPPAGSRANPERHLVLAVLADAIACFQRWLGGGGGAYSQGASLVKSFLD